MRLAYYRQRDGIVKSVPGLIRRCHRSARICIVAAKTAKSDGQASFSRWRTSQMGTPSRYLEAPRRLRAFVRAHETSLVVLAAVIGTIGGLAVLAMSVAVAALHTLLFNISITERLSSQPSVETLRAVLVPSLGGLLLGVALLLLLRWRPGREIDPIEANALHGGRMSFRGSVIVALQTTWSSGVGASVGLEAGYTQLASGLAASLGRGFHLRRADQRIMVGCGAAAAISGAFGAPLAGAFYAFELVIGGYTPASLTPVGGAAVAGYFVPHGFQELSLGVNVGPVGDVVGRDLAIAALLGILAALFGIFIMRGVALCEAGLANTRLWPPLRPVLGGLAVGLLALLTPQVMSSGHGALHFSGLVSMPLQIIAGVFVLKALASIVSLGSGFRGGLFFATLFMGALGGRLYAAGVDLVWPGLALDPNVYAGIGIEAFRVKFPLGSKTQVVAVDATGRYVGLAVVAEAHAPEIDAARGLAGILHHRDVVLHPVMNIQEAIAVFDAAEAESLAVVEADGERRPVGILTEAHAMRRYAEESDKRRREAIGEV